MDNSKRDTKPAHFQPLEVSSRAAKDSKTLAGRALKFQFIYSMAGLFLGLLALIIGASLFIRGITGYSSLSAKMLGLAAEISDAAPGAILFVIGSLIIYATRYDVKVK